MKLKAIIPFVVAIVLAGVALKMGSGILKSRIGQSVQVVVVTRDMEAGSQIKDGDVKLAAMPSGSIPPTSFTKLSDVIGRVVAIPVVRGQTIVKPGLAPEGSVTGLQALVPPGMRAVTMEVNEFSGVGGLLVPGARVDVVATLNDDETRKPVVRTLVQNAKVIAVAQKLTGKTGNELTNALPKSVTILVSARDAMALDLAANKSRPRLVLRGAADETTVGGGQITMSELISGPGSVDTTLAARAAANGGSATTQPIPSDPFAAAPPVYAAPGNGKGYSVQVINGGVVSEVTLDAPAQPTRGDDLARARGALPADPPVTYGLPRSGPQKN
jgi:pilus assembly protein CpaB